MPALDASALDQLFRTARTHNGWLPKPATDDNLRAVYELMKWAPTIANCSPAGTVLVRSREANERLPPALATDRGEMAMAARLPATGV